MQHHHPVTDADGQRPAGAAFTDHGTEDRGAQIGHFQQVACDRLGLTTLLGTHTGIGTGGIDKGHDRQFEAFRQVHQTQCLAIALGAWHAEVADHLFLGITALLLPDDNQWTAIQPGHAADNGAVIRVGAIPVQLLKIGKQTVDVVLGIGTLGMTRQLGNLPGGEIGKDGLGQALALCLQATDLLTDIDLGVVPHIAQLLDLRLQFGDGLLKFEKIHIHGLMPVLVNYVHGRTVFQHARMAAC